MGAADREYRAGLWWLTAAALVLRLLHVLAVDMPSNDGVQYLWQAARFAEGSFGQACSTPMPPGLGIVLAPFVFLGFDPETAAEVVLVICSTFTVHVLLRAIGQATSFAVFVALGVLLVAEFQSVRFTAEAYSEPLFTALTSMAVLDLTRGWRLQRPAICIGIAFWVRPEAAVFGLLLLGRGERHMRAIRTAVGIALAEPLFRTLCTGEFVLSPLLRFYGTGLVDGTSVPENLVDWFASLGRGAIVIWLILAIVGLIEMHARDPRGARKWVFAVVGLQLLQIFVQAKPRFFHSQLGLLVPLGAVGARTSVRTLDWAHKTYVFAVLVVAAVVCTTLSFADLVAPPRQDKAAERVLGELLAREGLQQGELVTDMPRVAYFAGLKPPPPAEWTAERLVPLLADERVRVAVLGRKRPGRSELPLQPGVRLEVVALPDEVKATEGWKRLLLLRRP